MKLMLTVQYLKSLMHQDIRILNELLLICIPLRDITVCNVTLN